MYDFLIIGAGIAGLSSAYHLSKAGYSVAVFEKNDGHQNASTNSTAIMSRDPDLEWQAFIVRKGLAATRQVRKLLELSMELLDEFAHMPGKHFNVRRSPAYIFSQSKQADRALRYKYEIYANVGIPVSFIENGTSVYETFNSVLSVQDEGETNNLALLSKLASASRRNGVKIFKNKEVVAITNYKNHVEIRTLKGESFQAKNVIIATGGPVLLPELKLGIETKRTFVIGFEKHGMKEVFRRSVMWDAESPYHYIRSFKGSVLWVGGEDIKESGYDPKQDRSRYRKLEKFARTKLKLDRSYKRAGEWTGTFFSTKTGLPYIYKVPGRRVYVNIGFGGTGILTAFVSGYLLAAWQKGKMRKYKKLFS